ncbi:MAG: hypothetical protein CM1200mP20_14980 [Pseudomonadota bacterium]|nr:MAG: hypothetical protein CM1200mP20_14980 [Pseudomonadota bacterium]
MMVGETDSGENYCGIVRVLGFGRTRVRSAPPFASARVPGALESRPYPKTEPLSDNAVWSFPSPRRLFHIAQPQIGQEKTGIKIPSSGSTG